MDKTSSYLIAISVIGIVLVSSIYALSPDLKNTNTLDVTGTFQAKTQPDRAYVYASVETYASTAQAAQDDNAQKMSSIMSSLSAYTVETVSYYIEPIYNYTDERYLYQYSGISGYRAVNSIKITLTDTSKAGTATDSVIKAGANKIDSVQFWLSDAKEREFRQQIFYNASLNAKQKADAIASGIGVHISKPIKISESYFNYMPYYVNAKAYDMAGSSSRETTILPGEIDVSASISVTYQIV